MKLKFSWRHMLVDAVLIVISLYASLWFRIGTLQGTARHVDDLHRFVAIFLVIRLAALVLGGVYRCMWRYVSSQDAIRLAGVIVLSTPLLISVTYLIPSFGYLPRSLFVIDAFVATAMLLGIRMVRRQLFEMTLRPQKGQSLGKMIIYGAGQNGRLLAQRLMTDPNRDRDLLGFIDDDPRKSNMKISGLKVLGNHSEVEELLSKSGCTDLVVAITNPPADLMRELLVLTRQHNIRLHKISHLENPKGEALFRKVELTDLLNRPAAEIDVQSVKSIIEDKVVLVTGAGGSIGSELSRQIARFSPRRLLLLDHSEFALYEIDKELRPQTQSFDQVIPLLVDIKDSKSLEHIFHRYQPEVIFHAAAYKHVHLVEANVGPAILNNVLGTKHLLELSEKYDCQRFVMISTDKAVNPVGAMGSSKRVCEILTSLMGFRTARPYSSVRFGNVLGSSGSLIPLLKKQIEDGGPVTLTHQDMTRYFMLIPEAVSLVLMSSTLSQPGDVNVLKMGEPIRILDLAKNLITLMGQTEEKIAIAFTGVRPGEKMYEELYLTGDELTTRHSEILTVPRGDFKADQAHEELLSRIDRLISLAKANDPASIDLLKDLANNRGLSSSSTSQTQRLH